MHRYSRIIASGLFRAAFCACVAAPLLAQVSVRSVRVMGSKDTVEVEVAASDRIVPETQVLSGPDRLVVDFPNAIPSSQVRSQSVDRGEVKDVRVGLFQSKPPITRVVLDLKAARSYQVFPYGRTVMIKVMGEEAASDASVAYPQPERRPGLIAANYTTGAEPIQTVAPVQPALQVSYRNGLLGIHANKATLSEILFAIQQRTGADISIAAGAEQEKVVAEIDPAPAPEVLARLLNGSRFNYLILSATDDPSKLDRVILSTRSDGGFVPPPQAQSQDQAQNDQPIQDGSPAGQPTVSTPGAVQPAPNPQGQNKPAEDVVSD